LKEKRAFILPVSRVKELIFLAKYRVFEIKFCLQFSLIRGSKRDAHLKIMKNLMETTLMSFQMFANKESY